MRILLIIGLGLFLEFWLMVAVAEQIGALTTVLATLATAVIGFSLMQKQGLDTLVRARHKMEAGESPAEEMVSGLALFVGGGLLLIPGFISDGFGILLMIPGIRAVLARKFLSSLPQGSSHFHFTGRSQRGGRTFEGEFDRTDSESSDPDKKNQNFLP